MWINYHHLFYFKTIAEQNSVSKAAEKLRLGQPTLSAQLKQFEDYLGVQLFERQHKKLILTEQGLLALDYAQSIFKLGSEMVDSLQDRNNPEKTRLQIGALDAIPKEVLTGLAQKFFKTKNTQNKVHLSFFEGNLNYLLRELEAHQIDLLITNHLPLAKNHKKINHHLLQKSQIKIFGTTEHKNLIKKFPESLNGQSMILPTDDSQLRADLDHWFKLQSVHVDIVAETQDVALKKQLAIQGLGLVAGTELSFQNELKNKDIFEIGTLSGVFESIYILTGDRKFSNPLIQKILNV